MNNNKFIKFLVILNGVMLPVLLGFAIFQISKDFFPRNQPIQQQRGLIVGEELEESKKDSIAWQGLDYGMPEDIYNSSNFLLKVGVKDYRKGEKLSMLVSNYSGDSYYSSYTNLVNVVFLDENYNVIRSLLNRKASISRIGTRSVDNDFLREPLKSYSTITYLIAFDDSNEDGKLNEEDNCDLYVSNLSGGDFMQITKGVDVENWEVYHDKSIIIIKYKERTNQEEEHKEEKFAVYSIKEKKLKQLGEVDSEIKKLEKIIRE